MFCARTIALRATKAHSAVVLANSSRSLAAGAAAMSTHAGNDRLPRHDRGKKGHAAITASSVPMRRVSNKSLPSPRLEYPDASKQPIEVVGFSDIGSKDTAARDTRSSETNLEHPSGKSSLLEEAKERAFTASEGNMEAVRAIEKVQDAQVDDSSFEAPKADAKSESSSSESEGVAAKASGVASGMISAATTAATTVASKIGDAIQSAKEVIANAAPSTSSASNSDAAEGYSSAAKEMMSGVKEGLAATKERVSTVLGDHSELAHRMTSSMPNANNGVEAFAGQAAAVGVTAAKSVAGAVTETTKSIASHLPNAFGSFVAAYKANASEGQESHKKLMQEHPSWFSKAELDDPSITNLSPAEDSSKSSGVSSKGHSPSMVESNRLA